MNVNLKKFLIDALAIIGCFVVIDFGVGRLFDGLLEKIPDEGEHFAKSNYSFTRVDEDIVITGSSRAESGYDCKILLDSLPQYSIYNCGTYGQNFELNNVLINSILDRYVPKAIVWDFHEDELDDMRYETEDLSFIYPYYWTNENIRRALNEKEDFGFKCLIPINSYRYNSCGSRIVRAILAPDHSWVGTFGYMRPKDIKNNPPVEPQDAFIPDGDLDKSKVEAFLNTAKRADSLGCKLIVVISPMYDRYNWDNFAVNGADSLCRESNAIFIDDSHLPGFVHNNEIAGDHNHLNTIGTERFSRILAGQLKAVLEK